jgi:hypothetical protein
MVTMPHTTCTRGKACAIKAPGRSHIDRTHASARGGKSGVCDLCAICVRSKKGVDRTRENASFTMCYEVKSCLCAICAIKNPIGVLGDHRKRYIDRVYMRRGGYIAKLIAHTAHAPALRSPLTRAGTTCARYVTDPPMWQRPRSARAAAFPDSTLHE